MIHAKFKGCNVGQPLRNDTFSIDDLKSKIITKYDYYLQYLGFHDAEETEVYDGDILQLTITPLLKDPQKNTFCHSNLGRIVSAEPNITHVLCIMHPDSQVLNTPYDVYFMRNGKLERDPETHEPKSYGYSTNTLFPQYLCNKGAVVVANILNKPDFLDELS